MKSLTCIIYALLLTTTVLSDQNYFMAEINYTDKFNKNHTFQISYYVQPTKVQYGVINQIKLYKFTLSDCELSTREVNEEVFASYIEVPNECDAGAVLKDAINHGSEFTFLKLNDVHNKDILISQQYDSPLFIVDEQQGDDPFRFEHCDMTNRFITVQFLIVS